MSFTHKGFEVRKVAQEYDKEYQMEVEESYEETSGSPNSMSPKGQLENEKRLRREIANSNERRRMQSINAGFDSLKTIIPHTEGEKLSKAAILQQTADYVTSLEAEKTKLLTQNSQLKRLLAEMGHSAVDSDSSSQASPPPKRKKRDTESSDEGIGLRDSEFEDTTMEDLKRERHELRMQLERERQLRMMLEEETRFLKAQMQFPAERLPPVPSSPAAEPTPVTPPVACRREKEKFYPEPETTHMETEPTVAEPKLSSSPSSVVLTAPTLGTPRANSMSRRNLETIVEAIRHLEGDSMLFDGKSDDSSSDSDKDCYIPSSCEEEDEEDEDIKSDCSSCQSPSHIDSRLLQATVHVQSRNADLSSQHQFPMATHLLQMPRPPSSPSSSPLVQQPTTQRQPVIVISHP